jgi:hypothetical protein
LRSARGLGTTAGELNDDAFFEQTELRSNDATFGSGWNGVTEPPADALRGSYAVAVAVTTHVYS